jgi:arginine decarboxylase
MSPSVLSRPSLWSPARSLELYNVEGWGNDCFTIDDQGHLRVRPPGVPAPGIDLKELVDEVVERGIGAPILLRFSELIRARVEEVHGAFRQAMDEYGYRGGYRGVYPIKVNQDRYLVEKLLEFGRPYHLGLEAGSKPELLAVMAMLEDPEALIVCNGYKDEEYIETALLASKLGRRVILVVEKPSEVQLIVELSRRTGIEPRIGCRARLSARGSGHWEASGGDRSKFGLGAADLVAAVRYLEKEGFLDSFRLLHFHLGSQISSIRAVQDALREAVWLYAHLVRMGAPLGYLDVGGGLGVDYDGSQTDFTSSLNYSLQEYANDIVFGIQEICDRVAVPHPTLVSESGRATVAHHAVLVIDVLGVSSLADRPVPTEVPEDAEPVVRLLYETHSELHDGNAVEAFHDATAYRDQCRSLFNLGHLTLERRALAEDLYWAVCTKALAVFRLQDDESEERDALERALADTYFCNFSLFQSLPDSWAIDQLFPVVPLHRLDEEPTERGVLADITCDSDGKIDHFIGDREPKPTLELHPFRNEPYYLGLFLVGAYQEILGDLHNLFGDTNTVHVSMDPDGGYRIDGVVEGDRVTEVLEYVRYTRGELVARLRRHTENALRARRMTREESRQLLRMYEAGLSGYTYLEQE